MAHVVAGATGGEGEATDAPARACDPEEPEGSNEAPELDEGPHAADAASSSEPSEARLAMLGEIGSQAEAGASTAGSADQLRLQCEAIANTYLLSKREAEVMFFLAHGFKSSYVQEKLYISEGTAKTHIRHIYRKLDVHSQQELMRLVDTVEL